MKDNLVQKLIIFGILGVVSISFFSLFSPSSFPERILFFLSFLIAIGSVAGFTVTLVQMEKEEEEREKKEKENEEKEKEK